MLILLTLARESYLGETMSKNGLDKLEQFGGMKSMVLPEGETVASVTAQLLAGGMIVGWVQGRAEFGPRALGNRSILADPRSADVKERLN